MISEKLGSQSASSHQEDGTHVIYGKGEANTNSCPYDIHYDISGRRDSVLAEQLIALDAYGTAASDDQRQENSSLIARGHTANRQITNRNESNNIERRFDEHARIKLEVFKRN